MTTPKKKAGQYPHHQSPFYNVKTKAHLASILKIELSELKTHIRNANNNYFEFDQTDSRGKKRPIQEPKPRLKWIHKRIENFLNEIFPPNYLFCPVKRRSYITNAKQHMDAFEVRCLDIKKYFPSTHASRVFQFFHEEMKCTRDVAGELMSLCTFNNYLPTGSPLSPILSFFAHKRMWERISKMVEDAGCQLTVYIDDLTVSGKKVPGSLIWAIKKEIKNTGLRYHKETSYKGKTAKKITGVMIKKGKLLLPNKKHLKIHRLRMELRDEIDPEKKKKLIERIRGSECQARQIKVANG